MSVGLSGQRLSIKTCSDNQGHPLGIVAAESVDPNAPDFSYDDAQHLVFKGEGDFKFEGEAIRFPVGKTIYAIKPSAIQSAVVKEAVDEKGRTLVLMLHVGPEFTLHGEVAARVFEFMVQRGYINPELRDTSV